MAFKYSRDDDIFNEVVNSIGSKKNKSTESNYYSQDDFLTQIDYYSNNIAKKNLEIEQQKQQRLEEEKKKKELEEYYNKNKTSLVKERTNSLIYNWDLDASGGQKYSYNNSKDTNTSDFYTNLGVNDLSLNNFLITDEEAENKKKSKIWQDQQNAKERFKNLSPLENKTTEANDIFNSITEQKTNINTTNPYENKDSYYKKYIEKFNKDIKDGNVKGANNALQKINEKYFGADYSDGILGTLFEGNKDADILYNRFDTNVKKLDAINNSIANGVDNETLDKLKTEKSKLEFENQLIQYNKLVTRYSLNDTYDTIDNIYKKVEDPFKNIDGDLKWDKDKGTVENVANNFATLVNRTIQTIGATANAVMETSFGSLNTFLTNDIENEDVQTITSGIIDFAEYLIPYVGQAKLYIDTASSGSVALPGLYDNLLAKPLGLEEQSSAILGDNPNALQTLGSSIYVAMNFVLDGLIKNSPLGKFSFDEKTTQEISKMTFGNIMKTLGVTSSGEALEEFFQAYGEDMMYGDKNRSLKEVITNKETFVGALRNAVYAFIVSEAVGGAQVGTSKLKYHNTITTNTKYAHVNDTAMAGINVDSTTVEKVNNEKLTETLTTALENNQSVDIISTDIDNDTDSLDIEYESPINTTSEDVISMSVDNTNIYKSNTEAITFDSAEKTILESFNNQRYYEARGLSENPTLQDIYELLVNNNDPMADKLFYYNELYGNRKYSTFLTNLNNGKITPELVAQQVLPENNKTNYSPNDIKNNTVTTVVPSQEMANYILANNPNADVEVIDVKSPTFNEDVKNYVNGKATYNLNLNKKIQNEKSPTTVDSKTIKNLNTELSDLSKTLSNVEAKEDTPISKLKIDNSALASGNFVDISNNVQENLLNTLDTENHSLEERRDHLKETLAILQKYNNETRTPIKQKGGKPVVFDKTGFNTYEATDTISTEDSTPAIVNSTGKFIYGNSEAKLNLSERAVNKINLMIDKLQLNGDKLTTRSTNKDVADFINKNKDMSKEILQILGYDGVLTGKQKTKLITATDNNDTVDIDKAFNKTTKKVDEIIAAEKEGSSKESFIAMMQIARETLQGETKTKPVKTGSKQLDSTKSSTKVKSDLNLDNKSITETKLDASQSDIKNNKLLDFDTDLSENEKYAVEKWRGADSYKLQDRLRRGEAYSKFGTVNGVNQTQIIKGIDSVLKKAPVLNGAFNRSLVFDTKEDMQAFVNKFKEGKTTIEKGYMTAAKTGIYEMEGLDGKHPDVIIQIKSNNAKDVSNIMRPDEVEVMFNRNTKLKTLQKIDDGKGHVYIQAEDVTNIKTKTSINTPIKSEVKVKAGDIEIKGNPEMISVDTLQDIEEAFNEVSVHNKKSTKELKNSFSKIYSAVFDRYSPILKIANDNSNLDVKNAISDLWTVRNRVHNNVKVEQTDINGNVVGKSLDTIKKQIKKQDLNDFQKTIRAILNVERINNEQEQILNLDAKKSKQYYDAMIKKHPYFKNVIDDLRVWNTNNTQKLLDAGLISIFQKEALDSKYTIYAPIYSAEPSDFSDIGEKSYNTKLKANDTLKPTTKQGKSILDIWTAFVAQEQNLENSILKNNTYKAMANSKLYSIDTKGKNTGTDIIYYDGGKVNKFTTNNEIAQVFQKYNIEKTLDDIFSIPALNWFPKLKTKVQQKMLTSYDPIYTANNMLRDFGDSALFYSKYPSKFAKNYARAAFNVANNSMLYQEITNTGIIPKTASTNKFTRILTSIESLPKMAEYISAIESGKTATEAKLEAQDVNLNFARGGYATQALNSKGWLFLNASTQALDKTVSTIKYDINKIKTNPIEGSLNLLMKVGAMSAPAMLNALMNQDDEDYEKLPYYYKNNYYMIKIGDNKFLRIPKGRIVGLTDTLVRYATGIDEEVDFKTYLESIKSSLETSVLPQDIIESGPFAEFIAIKNNKNYYGAEIYDENASLDEQSFSVINYISMNIFGRYGKAFKNLMDGDSTTDIVDVNSYIFDSTKYDKNLSSIYTLRDKYQYQKKNDNNMSFDDKVMKKYIDTKVYAINSISGDINKQKANGSTLNDMKDLYQMRDILTQDTIDNYNKYTVDKSSDTWTIYFDDETYTYNPKDDSFKKLKK